MKMLTPPADAQKAMHIAVGAASPLWFLYASAGAAGAGLFWMNRWRETTNLEALLGLLNGQAEVATAAAAVVAEAAGAAAEVVADPIVEALPEPVQEVVAAVMPKPVTQQTAPEPEPGPDDLTVLVGIGPKLAVSLAERGISRYADIAALTPKRIASLDKELRLMGRIERDAWIAQAKRLSEA